MRAFLRRRFALISLRTCSMALSQVESISAIFFCSERGGATIGILFNSFCPNVLLRPAPPGEAKPSKCLPLFDRK
jgi:hypothetical protein